MKRLFYVALATVFLVFGIEVLPTQAATTGGPFGPRVSLVGSVIPLFDKNDGAPSAGLGGRLFFAGRDARGLGSELWATDATGTGTRLVKDIRPGAEGSGPGNFIRFKNRVYFTAYDGAEAEWWVTDGTTAGTRRFVDFSPGTSSNPGRPVVAGNQMFFAATTAASGRELWVTDGTAAGTRLVKELGAGDVGVGIYGLTAFGTKVVFGGYQAGVAKAFVSDGTVAGTGRLDTTGPGVQVGALGFTVLGDQVLFSAEGSAAGDELWSSRGVVGDAQLFKEFVPGTSGGAPRSLVRLGSSVIFTVTTPGIGRELWSTDGTVGGTVPLRDIWPGSDGGDPSNLVRSGSSVYFSARTSSDDHELWTTDGSTAGTRRVADIRVGASGSYPFVVAAGGTRVLLSANDKITGGEPWVSDGTAAGTKRLGDFWPGELGSDPILVGMLGGTALFRVNTAEESYRLAAYTLPVARLKASPKKSYARSDAARKKIRIRVTVAGAGGVPTGRVALYKGSKRVGSATLSGGAAKVRITTKLRRGKHTLVVRYGGSLWAQSNSSVPFRIRVR
ncbi:ELWxxDGT repeat protein [Marmoricola sp. OAE513]|uniref:Ig-like domain repeat protein n=1 Tax=Marmoricola sp. OAE513 TaxID=2817894 RepID=UPI001AE8C105